MTTRAYDYIVSVANAEAFATGAIVFGLTSNTIAEVISKQSNNLKVKLSNIYSAFAVGETIRTNTFNMYSVNTFAEYSIIPLDLTFDLPITNALTDSISVYVDNFALPKEYYSVNNTSIIIDANYLPSISIAGISNVLVQVVTANTNAASFISSNISEQSMTANSSITAIYSSPYIAEKNATQQTPIVKLYSIYYPNEWYPANSNGNPSKSGSGYPWPHNFPIRYAEFLGETFTDFNYSISFANTEYKVVALNGGELSTDDTGTINGTTLEISNFDGVISSLIDSPNILGYNSSNSASAFVNGELVRNIDPRTILGNTYYDSSVAVNRGNNAAWDYESTIENGDTWISLRDDSRDLLGAIVEIKLTYAKFLDYWPEYSKVSNVSGNIITMYSSTPYRVGDVVYSSVDKVSNAITDIKGNNVYVNIPATIGSNLYIVNPDADKDSFVEYTFIISRLDELNDFTAKFSLTNLLQYFKMELPKRKFFRTTCPWAYKGTECKYPVNGSGPIIGSNPEITSNGFFTYDNVPTLNSSEDICAKTFTACALRRNLANFGGFSNGV
jgi:phage-related protein